MNVLFFIALLLSFMLILLSLIKYFTHNTTLIALKTCSNLNQESGTFFAFSFLPSQVWWCHNNCVFLLFNFTNILTLWHIMDNFWSCHSNIIWNKKIFTHNIVYLHVMLTANGKQTLRDLISKSRPFSKVQERTLFLNLGKKHS